MLQSLKSSSVFCCEDHFDLEKDVQDWIRYKILKDAGKPTFELRLKKGILPCKFDCQRQRTATHSKPKRSVIQKKDHMIMIKDILATHNRSQIEVQQQAQEQQSEDDILPFVEEGCGIVTEIEVLAATQDQSCQVELLKPRASKPIVRSKSCQTDILSIMHPKTKKKKDNEREEDFSPLKKSSVAENSEMDTSFHLSDRDSSSTDSESSESTGFSVILLNHNVQLMLKKSRYYLGLDATNVVLIETLMKYCHLEKHILLLVLRKIRLNEPFHELADIFCSTTSVISRQFQFGLTKIFPFIKTLVFWPNKDIIKNNQPLQFQANYSNVVSIIDCFEIQIEKPSKPSVQALTWSDYKSCNTLKYLISCTPAGLINFISEGYGGRASDMKIVEDSGYLEKLSPGSVILADRGFKQLDTILQERSCLLKRPPSVSSGVKLSREQVRETKKK